MGFFLTMLWTLTWVAAVLMPIGLVVVIAKRVRALFIELGRVSTRIGNAGSIPGKNDSLNLAPIPARGRCLDPEIVEEMQNQRQEIADKRYRAKIRRLHQAQERWEKISL